MAGGCPVPDGVSDMDIEREAPVDDRLRCNFCGDVIGVYEPLMHVFGGTTRPTSRAADPGLSLAAGEHYHLACYDGLGSGPSASPPPPANNVRFSVISSRSAGP